MIQLQEAPEATYVQRWSLYIEYVSRRHAIITAYLEQDMAFLALRPYLLPFASRIKATLAWEGDWNAR
jgi:hypothetical protein